MSRITPWTFIVIIGALLATNPAAAITCSPLTVTYVWVYPQDGTLVATVESPSLSTSAGWSLCSLKSTVGSFTPDMCESVYTELLVAKTTEVSLTIGFSNGLQNNSNSPALTCDEVPTFKVDKVAPYVLWVRLNR